MLILETVSVIQALIAIKGLNVEEYLIISLKRETKTLVFRATVLVIGAQKC